MLDPIAGRLAVQQTRDLVQSALPNAPVRRDAEPVTTGPLRRRAALTLRRLADRLEPAPRLSAGTG